MKKTPDFVRLANNILRPTFPNIAEKPIDLYWHEELALDTYMACGLYDETDGQILKGSYFIFIDPVMCDAPPEAIGGCFAHEYVHIERWDRLGYLLAKREFNKEKTLGETEQEEIATDLHVLERGLGHLLLAFCRFRENIVASGLKIRAKTGAGIPIEHLDYILQADGKIPHPLTYSDYIKYFGNVNG